MENLSDVLDREREADEILLLRDDLRELGADALFARGTGMWSLTIIEEAIREQERVNVLDAHELGHHRTILKISIGGRTYNIFKMSRKLQEKFEYMADREAASICLSPERIIEAYIEGCREPYEFAEALQITEEAFCAGMEHQKRRFGTRRFTYRGYWLTFEPIRFGESA